jgi:hypothetical protein
MRITLLKRPRGDTIAREDGSGGEFFLRDDGTVGYRNADDPHEWFVNDDEPAFRMCVAAFHRYNEQVRDAAGDDEGAQLAVVRRLADDLSKLGALPKRKRAFWPVVLEQAEHGML